MIPSEKATEIDWANASDAFDEIESSVKGIDLFGTNEAQTRFDVIDKMIKNVLGWQTGQIKVEEYVKDQDQSYIDYKLSVGDSIIIIEAKKIGATFPNPTTKTRLKINGSVLGSGVGLLRVGLSFPGSEFLSFEND